MTTPISTGDESAAGRPEATHRPIEPGCSTTGVAASPFILVHSPAEPTTESATATPTGPDPEDDRAVPPGHEDVQGDLQRSEVDGVRDELSKRLNTAYRNWVTTTMLFAREMGRMLLQAKSLHPRTYQQWVEEECEFSYSTAAGWVWVENHWDELIEKCGGNIQAVEGLTYTQARAMLAKPRKKAAIASPGEPGTADSHDGEDPESPPIADDGPGPDEGRDDGSTDSDVADEEDVVARSDRATMPGSSRVARRQVRAEAEAWRDDHDPAGAEVDQSGEREAEEAFDTGQAHATSDNPAQVADTKALAPAERLPIPSTTPGIANAPGGEPVTQIRDLFRRPLGLLMQARRGPAADHWEIRRLWSRSRALREQVARLLTAEHFSLVNECEKCGGAGFVAPDKPCDACASVGLVIVQEFAPPIDDSAEANRLDSRGDG